MTWPEAVDDVAMIAAITAVIVTWLATRHRRRDVCVYCPFAKTETRRRRARSHVPTVPGMPPPAPTRRPGRPADFAD